MFRPFFELDDHAFKTTDCHWTKLVSVTIFRHTIYLEFGEETMKPEKSAEAQRNAGIDSSATTMKQWYQGHDRVSDFERRQL